MNRLEYLELIKLLKEYEYQYYVKGESSVTDAEYDRLYGFLKQYEKDNPDKIDKSSPTQYAGVRDDRARFKSHHLSPMLSLSNCYDEDGLDEFLNRVGDDVEFCCEVKLDGLAVNLIYRDNVLSEAITRGDGKSGEDVLNAIKLIEEVPFELDSDVNIELLEVRGEVFLMNSDLDWINDKLIVEGKRTYRNARNAAAGILRQHGGEEFKKRLKFQAYGMGVVKI